jgi:hypothetical protein
VIQIGRLQMHYNLKHKFRPLQWLCLQSTPPYEGL